MDPESIRGRSRGVYDVLFVLSRAREALKADKVAEMAQMKPRNANRILSGLLKYGQVVRSEGEYTREEREDGKVLPVRTPFAYRITDRGIARMDWLKKNAPWKA